MNTSFGLNVQLIFGNAYCMFRFSNNDNFHTCIEMMECFFGACNLLFTSSIVPMIVSVSSLCSIIHPVNLYDKSMIFHLLLCGMKL